MLIEIVLFCATVLFSCILYKLYKVDRFHFEKRNLKYRPLSYSLSSLPKFFILTAPEAAQRTYTAFPNESIYGIVGISGPAYVVRDPELVKQFTIKDFDYFEDHSTLVDEHSDKLWGNSLIMLKGKKWRQMRATLSPAFTGTKMRKMYKLVSECVEEVVKHSKQRNEKLDVEAKDLFTRYTNDVIASCAFGLKINSLIEPNNEFYLNAKKVSSFNNPIAVAKMLLHLMLPNIARALKIRIVNPTIFKSIILDTMEFRQKNNIFRPDMINIMMQVRDGSLKHDTEDAKESPENFSVVQESDVGKATVNIAWNDDELVAQCFIFLVAGFETTSNILSLMAYELVINQDVQQELYEEIAEMDKNLNGKPVDYDVLQKLKYFDQVVSEVLRKYPPLAQPDRLCVKDYAFDDGNNLKFTIKKGSRLFMTTYGIHHDPKYYPNPDKFDPERFNDENKGSIKSGTYLPFGIGPRNCIGSRFALMEIKAIFYHLLLNYSLEANEKTEIPLQLKRTPITPCARNGVHLRLKPRIT
ncbi:probable cytochrome P450 9f2 [Contarinia nasturtii]|uniref:probable cytochrome P450 9f2 n=1 Tax=Contarinia nasturtii TaxID=265458 RepID=UPI0012D48B8A|nr:probable cytochrome P450 9f2 [Contarinia nasturtii]